MFVRWKVPWSDVRIGQNRSQLVLVVCRLSTHNGVHALQIGKANKQCRNLKPNWRT